MFDLSRQGTKPLKFPRTKRNRVLQNMSSCTIGKMWPIGYVPLLREDEIHKGRARINFRLQETAEIIVNPIRVNVRAYLVTHLCDPRFEKSIDQLNRSYAGQPQVEGGDVVPFIETHAYGTAGSKAVYKALGLHAPAAKEVNTFPLKAFNLVWNFLAANRSADLTPRDLLDATLAPAFWDHSKFAHLKPTFDAAVMEGEVALNIVDARVPVRGIGVESAVTFPGNNVGIKDATGNPASAGAWAGVGSNLYIKGTAAGASALPDIFGELQAQGITVSLANIELAKETQAFAKLREQFDGRTDEWIIDNYMMNGIEIPDLAMTQPVLIGRASTVFSQTQRFATDSGALDESATDGATYVDIPIRLPKGQRVNTGGVIMIVAEVLPEQLWERQRDVYFHSTDVSEWPEALRDTLNPQKVEEVFNGQIDTSHATPNGLFGFGPQNWEWDMRMAQIGGRFFAPAADGTFDEDRQRFYAVERVNPTLSSAFYICEGIHQNPFLHGGNPTDGLVDVVDAVVLGNVEIVGNTQFGPALIEANGNWDQVLEEVDTERLEPAEE